MSKSASTSFVFANAKGELGHIVSQLKRVGNIESVTPVTGRFDLVIRLKTNEPIKAFNIVEKIRSITGITSTQTAFSIENVSNAKNRETPITCITTKQPEKLLAKESYQLPSIFLTRNLVPLYF